MRAARVLPLRHARGFAAVELALMVPAFLFMMVATEEIGRALYQYNTLTKSVRDAAQYLAREGVNPGTGLFAPTGAQETAARNLIVYGVPAATDEPLLTGLSTSNVTLSYQAVPAGGLANHVTVTATYTFVPIGLSGLLGDLAAPGTLTASVQMRAL